MKKNILIIGYGQIGKSIEGLYKGKEEYAVFHKDLNSVSKNMPDSFDVTHICIPNIDCFSEKVALYIEKYTSKIIIINSTVNVGTIKDVLEELDYLNIKVEAIGHSPVMGIHPNLTKSIQTFTKIIGAPDKIQAGKISKHFEDIGVKTIIYDKPENSEAAKLLSTTYYAWNIYFMKFVKKYCDAKGLNFEDVYTTTNEIYNAGYEKFGMNHVKRPVLKYIPGPIGGHCLIPNLDLFDYDFFPAQVLKKLDSLEKMDPWVCLKMFE